MKIVKRSVLLVILALVISEPLTAGENTRLTNMTVTNNRDTLLFYMELSDAFGEDIMSALESGVTLYFSYPISVKRNRNLWIDKNIIKLELIHTIKFDTLKKDYIVTRSWQIPESETVKSLDEAIKLTTHIDGLALIPLAALEKGARYKVVAQARLSKISRPSYLKYMLFFLNSWKFKTKQSLVDFIY